MDMWLGDLRQWGTYLMGFRNGGKEEKDPDCVPLS